MTKLFRIAFPQTSLYFLRTNSFCLMSIDPKRSREVFQNLERDLVKLASNPQAKAVHRFRTGTRRLQILLSELSPKLDRSDKKLLKQLGRDPQARRQSSRSRHASGGFTQPESPTGAPAQIAAGKPPDRTPLSAGEKASQAAR